MTNLNYLIGKLIKAAFEVQGYGPANAGQREFMDDRYYAAQNSANQKHKNEIPNISFPNPGRPVQKPAPIYQKYKPQTQKPASSRTTP